MLPHNQPAEKLKKKKPNWPPKLIIPRDADIKLSESLLESLANNAGKVDQDTPGSPYDYPYPSPFYDDNDQ